MCEEFDQQNELDMGDTDHDHEAADNNMTATDRQRYAEMLMKRGLIASTAIQCRDPRTGETGDWIYSGRDHTAPGAAQSPLFHNIIKLVDWCRANGWKPCEEGYVYEPTWDQMARENECVVRK